MLEFLVYSLLGIACTIFALQQLGRKRPDLVQQILLIDSPAIIPQTETKTEIKTEKKPPPEAVHQTKEREHHTTKIHHTERVPHEEIQIHKTNIHRRNIHTKDIHHRTTTPCSKIDIDFDASGWLDLATTALGKKVWKKHYFVLQGEWLGYFKDEEMKADHCLGWIKLTGCEMDVLRNSGKPKILLSHPKFRIFHRHGPDPNMPPVSLSSIFFHRKSTHCILRCGDDLTIDYWFPLLQKAVQQKITRSWPSESEGEESSLKDGEEANDDDDFPSEASPLHATTPTEHSEESPPRTGNTSPRTGDTPPRTDLQTIQKKEENVVVLKDSEANAGKELEEKKEDTISPSLNHAGAETEMGMDNREGMISFLEKLVGVDLTNISIPVSFNEPTTVLQRMCEAFQYYPLLEKANHCSEELHRLVYVTAFSISCYASSVRTRKPFNPALGETFEYEKKGEHPVRFVSEQVIHHPPVACCYIESPDFILNQDYSVKVHFQGNSLAASPSGNIRVHLKKSGEEYSWGGVESTVHNVILGTMWVEHHGQMELRQSNGSGFRSLIEFKKSGWFTKGNRFQVQATIFDSSDTPRATLQGKWTEYLTAKVSEGAPPLPEKNETIWTNSAQPIAGDSWKFSPFTRELLSKDSSFSKPLVSTDSRLRPDRLALEGNDLQRASQEKKKLEIKHREERAHRQNTGQIWRPQYFERKGDAWVFNHHYAERNTP